MGLDLLFRRRVTGNNNIVVSYTPDEEDRSKLGLDGGMRLRAGGALEQGDFNRRKVYTAFY